MKKKVSKKRLGLGIENVRNLAVDLSNVVGGDTTTVVVPNGTMQPNTSGASSQQSHTPDGVVC